MANKRGAQTKRNPVATSQLLKKGGPHGRTRKAERKHKRDNLRKRGLDD